MNWFHAVSRFLGQTSPHLTFEVTGVTMFLQWVLVWEKEELGAAGVGVASFPAPSRLLPNAQGRELHTWAGVGDVLLPLIPAPHAGTAPAWGAVQEPLRGAEVFGCSTNSDPPANPPWTRARLGLCSALSHFQQVHCGDGHTSPFCALT